MDLHRVVAPVSWGVRVIACRLRAKEGEMYNAKILAGWKGIMAAFAVFPMRGTEKKVKKWLEKMTFLSGL